MSDWTIEPYSWGNPNWYGNLITCFDREEEFNNLLDYFKGQLIDDFLGFCNKSDTVNLDHFQFIIKHPKSCKHTIALKWHVREDE